MNLDFQKILESKAAYRRKLAALPIGEKLTLLDAMRERAIAIRHATSKSGSNLLREDPVLYDSETGKSGINKPLNDPDFIGAQAALDRAAVKILAQAKAAGLEPVVSNPDELPKQP